MSHLRTPKSRRGECLIPVHTQLELSSIIVGKHRFSSLSTQLWIIFSFCRKNIVLGKSYYKGKHVFLKKHFYVKRSRISFYILLAFASCLQKTYSHMVLEGKRRFLLTLQKNSAFTKEKWRLQRRAVKLQKSISISF